MNRRIKLSSPSATHLFHNWIMHSRLRSWKIKQVPCLLRANGFLFLPRMHGMNFKLITSPHQWIKLPKSICFLWTQPFYENKLKKKACSCQFYVEIKANDANGCYPLRSMKRIGSLKNNYLSLHVNIRIRHRNQSLEQYYKNLACGYLPPPGVLKLLKTPFILLESDDRLFAYRVHNRRILSWENVNSVLFGFFTFQFLRGIMK